jgi:eukaryotic-like serine/threonine-protein kinase
MIERPYAVPRLLIGQPAPKFDLPCTRPTADAPGRFVLEEHRGRWVLVLFYPRDFTFVCPTEISAVSAELDEFRIRDCDVVGISVDPVDFHEEWIDTEPSDGGIGPLRFPLASDMDGQISRQFGVFQEAERVAARGLFVIDPYGLVQYQVVHPVAVGRSADEPLRVLDALRKGGLCPSGWKRGDGTLDPAAALHSGTVLGHYRLGQQLGQGTYARVFRATDLWLQRDVAVKVLRTDGPVNADFVLREARAAAALNHPNICTVHAVEKPDGVPIIVMELLHGQSLAHQMRQGGLTLGEVKPIVSALTSALTACHAADLVHGDLKPGNVIVDQRGVAKILDFGIASFHGEQVLPDPQEGTVSGSDRASFVRGTPWYMAPERFYGEPATSAADVFSFGAVLYQLATGHLPFTGDSLPELIDHILHLNPRKLVADVPEPFRPAIRATMVREPGKRAPIEQVAELI